MDCPPNRLMQIAGIFSGRPRDNRGLPIQRNARNPPPVLPKIGHSSFAARNLKRFGTPFVTELFCTSDPTVVEGLLTVNRLFLEGGSNVQMDAHFLHGTAAYFNWN